MVNDVKRGKVARLGEVLVPVITCVAILAIVLYSGVTRPGIHPVYPSPGAVLPSGSYNTRVYVTGINTLSQVQGDYFVVDGYVTVANVSSSTWDPWPNVAIALLMNNSFIFQGPALVQDMTDASGNFTLSYRVGYNHTVGNWNITAGVAPSPGYNYTYNPLFAGTTVYDVEVTADVIIPQPLQYSPDVFFYNDAFIMRGRLLTEGGLPVPGVTIQASFNNTANYTSSITNATGHFTVDVNPPINNGGYDSLILRFQKTGFYNARSVPVPGFKFLDQVVHAFTGTVAASSPSNPTPVNTTITISGRYTYDAVTFGAGDGNVKNKPVNIFWNGALVASPLTDALGQYQIAYPISSMEPTMVPFSSLPIMASLGAAVGGQNATATFHIRPMYQTRVVVTTRPVWKDEAISIKGTLSENEPPTYTRAISGRNLVVTLWDGAVPVASVAATTNVSGGFEVNFPAQYRDALNYTVSFPGQGPYTSCSMGGAVLLYQTAVFSFNPGMPTAVYAGPPYPIRVFGRAFARFAGQQDLPIPNRQINVYWNGSLLGAVQSLDGNGYFDFPLYTNFTTPAHLHTITLELRGIGGPGYSVASSRAIQILPLIDLAVGIGDYITNPVFPDEGLTIDGAITERVGGLEIYAFLEYNTSLSILYTWLSNYGAADNNLTTSGSGTFRFVIGAAWINTSLVSVRIVVNPFQLAGCKNATTIAHPLAFIDPYASPSAVSFSSVSVDGVPAIDAGSVVQGSSITLSGKLISHTSTNVSFYRVMVIDASTGQVVASGLTDGNGEFSVAVEVTAAAGSDFSFYLRTDYDGGAILYTSVLYTVSVVASNTLNWILWLIPVIAAGLIVFAWVYVKIQKKQEISRIRSYMQQKLDLVRQLVAVGKYREGIAYCYHTLVEVASRAYNLDEIKESETVREFIEMLVNQKNLPREPAYKFMVSVLDGLYSKQDISQDHVASVVRMFGNLYVAITNDTQETFTL